MWYYSLPVHICTKHDRTQVKWSSKKGFVIILTFLYNNLHLLLHFARSVVNIEKLSIESTHRKTYNLMSNVAAWPNGSGHRIKRC